MRIGVDNVTGSATGSIDTLADGTPVRSYRVADFAALSEAIDNDELTIVDVRQTGEYDESHVRRALNVPLPELIPRIDEVPAGEVWVYCASGYRSSIAASIIDRPERTVVLIDDTYENAGKHDLTTVRRPDQPRWPAIINRPDDKSKNRSSS